MYLPHWIKIPDLDDVRKEIKCKNGWTYRQTYRAWLSSALKGTMSRKDPKERGKNSRKYNVQKVRDKLEKALEGTGLSVETLQDLKLAHWLTQQYFNDYQILDEINLIKTKRGEEPYKPWQWEDLKKLYPEFFEIEANWHERAVNLTEKALYRLALGFPVYHEQLVTVGDGDGYSHVERHIIKKQLAPDFRSIRFILTNTKPEAWQDKGVLTLDKVKNMSDGELSEMVKKALAQEEVDRGGNEDREDFNRKNENKI